MTLRIAIFDRDMTLEPFGGPVPFSILKAMQGHGWLLATGGSADPMEQEAQWLARGVRPDLLCWKGGLNDLARRFPDATVIYVDDGEAYAAIAEKYGWAFHLPAAFIEWWSAHVEKIVGPADFMVRQR